MLHISMVISFLMQQNVCLHRGSGENCSHLYVCPDVRNTIIRVCSILEAVDISTSDIAQVDMGLLCLYILATSMVSLPL